MTNSDVFLASASATESCDTSYSSSKKEMKVAGTVQLYEGEPRALLLSQESAKAEAIVVEPVKRKTSEFVVIWFKLISKRDFKLINREKLLQFMSSVAIRPILPNR